MASLYLLLLLSSGCCCFLLVHVHAGNVVIDGDNCRLLDIENSLLGIPSLHRREYMQLHKLHVSVQNTCVNKAKSLLCN